MSRTRKQVVVPVASLLCAAFLIGMIMSFFLTAPHEQEHWWLWKAAIGTFGPFMVLITDGRVLLVGMFLLVLLITPIVIGIVKCRLAPALLGAIPLALLWAGSMLVVCIWTNL